MKFTLKAKNALVDQYCELAGKKSGLTAPNDICVYKLGYLQATLVNYMSDEQTLHLAQCMELMQEKIMQEKIWQENK